MASQRQSSTQIALRNLAMESIMRERGVSNIPFAGAPVPKTTYIRPPSPAPIVAPPRSGPEPRLCKAPLADCQKVNKRLTYYIMEQCKTSTIVCPRTGFANATCYRVTDNCLRTLKIK